MTNEEINKSIHEFLGKKPHHENGYGFEEWNRADAVCSNCKRHLKSKGCLTPDYTSESAPRSLLSDAERKVVEEFGFVEYWAAINYIVNMQTESPDFREIEVKSITAPAIVRATAIAELVKEK